MRIIIKKKIIIIYLMNGNGFEVIEEIRDYFTYYFIETHLKSLNNEIEIIVDSSHKCLKPIRKILEKEIKDDKNQVFMASVYGIDFKPSVLKRSSKVSLFPSRTSAFTLSLFSSLIVGLSSLGAFSLLFCCVSLRYIFV